MKEQSISTLNLQVRVGEIIRINHCGEVLELFVWRNKGITQVHLKFKAPRSFKIDRTHESYYEQKEPE